MQLKLRELLTIKNACDHVLGGRNKVIRKNNEDTVVNEPYKVDAETLMRLAQNSNLIAPIAEAHTKTTRLVVGDQTTLTPELSREIEDMLDASQDVKLFKIDVLKLKVDENSGISVALPALLPILKFAVPTDAE